MPTVSCADTVLEGFTNHRTMRRDANDAGITGSLRKYSKHQVVTDRYTSSGELVAG